MLYSAEIGVRGTSRRAAGSRRLSRRQFETSNVELGLPALNGSTANSASTRRVASARNFGICAAV
jgi:hypothetical protein